MTVDGEGNDWYEGLAGESAYEKLVEFRRLHLKRIRICGRRKRWWDSELSAQVKVVRRERRGWRRVGHRNVLRSEIAKMKRMVKEKKYKCWRAFCEDLGLQSPCEVVRWARDPWRERERIGRLKGSNGVWVDSDEEKVGCLVSEVFGLQSGGARIGPRTWDRCPMSREELQCSVRRALGRTKNGSAPGPDGIGYRLIKAVKDTRLGRELMDEVVDNLWRGVFPEAWRQMRVVFIPKPGRDLTVARNWRPLNLINCVGKLCEKVVADRIQDYGDELFHKLQFGSVRGRSAVDMLYRSVVRARACIDKGGSVGWGFWDVKVGFQNVVGEEVLRILGEVRGTKGLCSWVEQFVAPRVFEVSWDRKVRGVGRTSTGVPQGSPLSPVLFLVWLAPILTEMERRIKEEVPGVGVEFPSYVDDLHCGLYDGGRAVRDEGVMD